jgi:D-alanyl-lipoteichoic acid acyltransferase DltB (MBOAT superfamily)
VLFNSYEFIFAFLPIALAGFFLVGKISRNFALAWIVLASLVFYAWWRPLNVLIIAPSILINFVIARALVRLSADKDRKRAANTVLIVGIVFNVMFLGYFKYTNFFATALNDTVGTNFVLTQIILPLGISFITFQKIAFLIDVHARRVQTFTLGDYCLFVLFFPQLIAGPIVHYREMMPQFHRISCRFDAENISVGLTMFVIGLFKKVVLADGVAAHVSPIYDLAAAGGSIALLDAWVAALGFTLQIYFDFSGYSDMALGLGRCFGVKLPPNFDSPLKASSIIDFWLRWHMTLTRFLTAYLYNPMVLALTRRRFAKGLREGGSRNFSAGGFVELLAGPTILTMLVSGLWHGAGYLFLLWGLLHGVYLTINHAWRQLGPRLWASKESYERFMKPVGWALTFLSVAFAMVLFRATTIGAAKDILRGMFGLNGLTLPQQIVDRLGPLVDLLHRVLPISAGGALLDLTVTLAWIAALLVIALVMPNSLDLLSEYEPALGIKPRPGSRVLARLLHWSPQIPWAFATSALAVTAIMMLGHKTEFLYWQF